MASLSSVWCPAAINPRASAFVRPWNSGQVVVLSPWIKAGAAAGTTLATASAISP